MEFKIKNELITYDFFYIFLVLLGVTVLSLCDTFLLKIMHFNIFGFDLNIAFSGALFPIGLIVSNAISERYSPTHSYFFIIVLAVFQFIYSGSCVLISYIPSEHYMAYAEVYQRNGLVCIGGTLGILIGYSLNHQSIKFISNIFDYIPLLVRDLFSNIVSKFFICFFSYTFVFWGKKTFSEIMILILSTWLFKIIVGSILIPLVVPLVKYITYLKNIKNMKPLNYT